MWSGRGAAGTIVSFLTVTGCIAQPVAPATTARPSPAPQAVATASPPSPSPERTVHLQLSAAGFAVDDAPIGSDPSALKATVAETQAAILQIVAEPTTPASLVLAALTLEVPASVERMVLTWQDVRLELSPPRNETHSLGEARPAAIFSWRAAGATQLWSISAGAELANLGYSPLGTEESERSAVSSLKSACAATGCTLALELPEEELQAELRAWQRLVAAVGPKLSLRFLPARRANRNSARPDLGRLPPEVIQTVVRFGFERFKNCYEAGLARNPQLEGRVLVKFTIERDGTVKTAADAGSDLADAEVRDCVVRQFVSLRFPAPATGIVIVSYPILLAPG